MKIKQTAKSFWLAAAGALIAVPGTLALIFLEDIDWSTPERILLGTSIFFGWKLFGSHLNKAFFFRLAEKNPEIKHELILQETDERNVTIAHMAGSKAFNVMSFLFAFIIVLYAVLQVGGWFLAGLVAAFLIAQGAWIYFLIQLQKNM